ncbi:lysine N(6)-hydroxylase/L-ornithine N(5)-oxygenase family protein [Streptomyces griseomycini]|uniref:L-lysine N6-monooxygenase MbtG n=1 Tax=Streptomyces griseomycini TaxID=66895 RepID=A0A7W7LU30_9ACTN|nr:SidA/IucD/PvdA family monooxygenase [Streptomyces griseomycini]MBB4896234.1 lysine N6-hydroxylase [Streptomyces griseomycini]GGP82912.1 monooxygenase [Streptomyces griseomycini]GGR03789.1 monooxygenase [Streptomyces griseomycini]
MTPTAHPDDPAAPHDLVGIGIGPANLSLAALAHPLTRLRTAFYDQRPHFTWHPGLLLDDATVQVPFLADLVTLVDPTSPWTFLNHLKDRERLYPFYFAEHFHIRRTEYDAYCRWVAGRLPALHFGHRADAVRWNPERALFEIDLARPAADGGAEATGRAHARNVVLGIGSEPHVPGPLGPLAEDPDLPVLHAADYLAHRDTLLAAGHVTVVGTGQSGAEVFLDLLRRRPAGRERLHWIGRTEAFAPMEYSKLGLEHFTPDHTRYFHDLPEPVRDRLVPAQWQLHKAVDAATLAAVHDELYRRTLHGGWPDTVLTPGVRVRTAGRLAAGGIELHLEHPVQGTRTRLVTDAVVLATGHRQRPLDRLLAALDPHLRRDRAGRPRIDEHFRLVLDPPVTGTVYVQNAELHTHGVGAPDLGLAAWRSATILNHLTGGQAYRLPARTAFTTFGLHPRTPQVPSARRAGRLTPLADGT